MCALLMCLFMFQDASQDNGDFVVYRAQHWQYTGLANHLHDIQYLESFVAEWNSVLNLPMDIAVRFAECGQANAFYNPEEVSIVMCLELLDYFIGVFTEHSSTAEEAFAKALGAYTFTLHHELGHALVDVLDLPVTGKEEDAVDQLSATIFLDDADPASALPVLDAAFWFLSEAEKQEEAGVPLSDLPFYGEHSLSPARFYNLLCWVYGSNPEEYQFFVTDGLLPESRAVRCPNEYDKFSDAWYRLLDYHWKSEYE